MTLATDLAYDDGTAPRHELVDGILAGRGAESDVNVAIGSLRFSIFLQFAVRHSTGCFLS